MFFYVYAKVKLKFTSVQINMKQVSYLWMNKWVQREMVTKEKQGTISYGIYNI